MICGISLKCARFGLGQAGLAIAIEVKPLSASIIMLNPSNPDAFYQYWNKMLFGAIFQCHVEEILTFKGLEALHKDVL